VREAKEASFLVFDNGPKFWIGDAVGRFFLAGLRWVGY
jgi:hypothetical protein